MRTYRSGLATIALAAFLLASTYAYALNWDRYPAAACTWNGYHDDYVQLHPGGKIVTYGGLSSRFEAYCPIKTGYSAGYETSDIAQVNVHASDGSVTDMIIADWHAQNPWNRYDWTTCASAYSGTTFTGDVKLQLVRNTTVCDATVAAWTSAVQVAIGNPTSPYTNAISAVAVGF